MMLRVENPEIHLVTYVPDDFHNDFARVPVASRNHSLDVLHDDKTRLLFPDEFERVAVQLPTRVLRAAASTCG